MKLYWGPRSCAIGIHVLLQEIGRPYETEMLDMQNGAHLRPPFSEINPKSKVPTLLRDDGSVLTEYGAIATWLARANPEKNLLPADPEGEARVVEVMDYVTGTLHMQGFARIFRPGRFVPDEALHDRVQAQGRELVSKGFTLLARTIGSRPYVSGEFSVADSALFFIERWAEPAGVVLPDQIAAHHARMRARPAVAEVLRAWGEG